MAAVLVNVALALGRPAIVDGRMTGTHAANIRAGRDRHTAVNMVLPRVRERKTAIFCQRLNGEITARFTL
jgi:hypothetical protein